MKKIILAMALILTLSCVALPAFAAEAIDTGKTANLTVSLMDGTRPIPGAAVYIWKAADVSGSSSSIIYTPTEKFSGYDLSFDFKENIDWTRFVNTAVSVIDANSIVRDAAARSDGSGNAVFSGLETGLYIIRVSQTTANGRRYTFQPAVILLPWPQNPGAESYEWVWTYDVTIMPKQSSEPVQETTSDTNPPDTNPPDTTPPDTNPPDNPPDNPPTPDTPPDTPPDNPPTPESPSEEPSIEIPDDDIPLIFPPSDTPEDEIIPDDEIPMGVPKIPKSGLLWWPVPILGIAGVGLIAGGAILRKHGEKNG